MSDRHTAPDADPPSRGLRVALGVVAMALLTGGWFLPLWVATLYAPQYPGGLSMRAYGHDVTGDVDEISGLNHYVGMRPFDLADFPEIALWPFALAGAAVAVVLALLVGRRLLRALGLVYLWGTPVGVLAVIQYRLWQYGQDLDPNAASASRSVHAPRRRADAGLQLHHLVVARARTRRHRCCRRRGDLRAAPRHASRGAHVGRGRGPGDGPGARARRTVGRVGGSRGP
jgi:hypothetical protein